MTKVSSTPSHNHEVLRSPLAPKTPVPPRGSGPVDDLIEVDWEGRVRAAGQGTVLRPIGLSALLMHRLWRHH